MQTRSSSKSFNSLGSTLARILKGELLEKSRADNGTFSMTRAAFENVVDDMIAFGLLIIVLLKTVLEVASVLLTRVSTRVVQALSLRDGRIRHDFKGSSNDKMIK